MTKIAVFVGSLTSTSINKKLAEKLEVLAPESVEFVHANLDLPLFSQDVEGNYPAAAQANKDLVASADGVLFITPEYNRSVPGVLKNAIDWASRPWGTNSFDGKPAAVAGVSIGPVGTVASQHHLKSILVYLNTQLLGQPEVYLTESQIYGEDGEFKPEVAEQLKAFLTTFVDHVEAHSDAGERELVAA